MKIATAMVSFFTDGWTQQCVECFKKLLPNTEVLVVDNNPTSFNQIDSWNKFRFPHNKCRNLFRYCLAERDWLKSNVTLLDNTGSSQKSHGQGMDIALSWCKTNQIDVLIAIDPDCVFYTIKWFHNLLQPIIKEDAWMTTRHTETRLAEQTTWGKEKFKDWTRIEIPIMMQVDKIQWSLEEVLVNETQYDCMAWAFQNCEKKKIIGKKNTNDFKHFWSGSYRNIVHNARNCPYVLYL